MTVLRHISSTVAGKVPDIATLSRGIIAINHADGALYFRHDTPNGPAIAQIFAGQSLAAGPISSTGATTTPTTSTGTTTGTTTTSTSASTSTDQYTETSIVDSTTGDFGLVNNNAQFNITAPAGGNAIMSFNSVNAFAAKIGVEADLGFVIGGWSLPAAAFRIDGSGNVYTHSNVITGAGLANQFVIDGSVAGQPVYLQAQGADADISVQYQAKGDGLHEFNSEIVVTAGVSGNHLRLNPASAAAPGIILRNDGANFYVLKTPASGQNGAWDGTRPFVLNLTSGAVSMSQGLAVSSGLNVGGGSSIAGGLTLTGNLSAQIVNSSATISVSSAVTGDFGPVNDAAQLNVTAPAAGNAIMSFNSAGAFAAKIGVTSTDFVIGGWSLPANALVIDGSGNTLVANGVYAGTGLANQLLISGNTSGNSAYISAQGADANINVSYLSKGAGQHFFNSELNVQPSNGTALRIRPVSAASAATLIYSDDSNFYILKTAANDQNGNFDATRPLQINLATGYVGIGNGLQVSNGLSVHNGAVIDTMTVSGAANIASLTSASVQLGAAAISGSVLIAQTLSVTGTGAFNGLLTLNGGLNASTINSGVINVTASTGGDFGPTNNTAQISVSAPSGQNAMLSFNTLGSLATKIGVTNSHFVIGGWSLPTNAFQIDTGGNALASGAFFAGVGLANQLVLVGGNAGNTVYLTAQGSDASINCSYFTKGNGQHYFNAPLQVQTQAGIGLRIKPTAISSPATLLFSDSDTFYILKTNPNDQGGSFDDIRPFAITLATGNVTMSTRVTMSDGVSINGGLNVDTISIGGNAAAVGSFTGAYLGSTGDAVIGNNLSVGGLLNVGTLTVNGNAAAAGSFTGAYLGSSGDLGVTGNANVGNLNCSGNATAAGSFIGAYLGSGGDASVAGNMHVSGVSYIANYLLCGPTDGNYQPAQGSANGFSVGNGNISAYNSAGNTLNIGNGSASNFVNFYQAGVGIIGSIYGSGSQVAYNTNSDYRIKVNVVLLTSALDRVNSVPARRFAFVEQVTDSVPDPTSVDGFLAHEVAACIPEAVTGDKDGMKTYTNVIVTPTGGVIEGVSEQDFETRMAMSPPGYAEGSTYEATHTAAVYQQLDQTRMVPVLWASVQELSALVKAQAETIATLVSQVAALQPSSK